LQAAVFIGSQQLRNTLSYHLIGYFARTNDNH
jgi:hypothetical protein